MAIITGKPKRERRVLVMVSYSIWPTSLWHLVHDKPPAGLVVWAGSIADVISAWHFRHAISVTC